MSDPSRAITNSYQDCRLITLDANDPSSPLVVVQEGYAPGDPAARPRLFYLQRDGQWIDEISRSKLPDNELADVVFDTPGDVMRVLAKMIGGVMVRHLPVTEADVQAYLTRMKSITSPADALKGVLARYRSNRGAQH
jgi:hypothetical protein